MRKQSLFDYLMGDGLIDEGHMFQRNNDTSCKQIRFRLHTIFAREMQGILGSNNRVRPLE